MASYQVSMPDGSSYQVDMPDATAESKSVQPSNIHANPFGSNRGGKNTTDFDNVPNLDTMKEVIKAPAYGALNAYDTLKGVADKYDTGDKPNGPYAESELHQNLDLANTQHQAEMDQTPAGNAANAIGQLATPLPELNLIGDVSKGAGAIAKMTNTVGKGLQKVGSGALQGATLATEQAKPATNNSTDLANQAEQTLSTGAAAGGIVGGATGLAGKLKNWYDVGKDWISKSGIEKTVGKNLPEELGQKGTQDLEQHVANPNAKDLTLAEVTQNPSVASAQKQLFTGSEKNDLTARNQSTNSQLADELQHLDVTGTNSITAPAEDVVGNKQAYIQRHFTPTANATSPEIEGATTPVQAQEQTGALARDISNQKRQEIKDAYTAIAPDDTVKAPLENLQANMDNVREKHGSAISNDNQLSEIDNRYSSENEGNTGSVKQMLQDKNALGDYVSTQYKALRNPNAVIDAATGKRLTDSISAAQEMRDTLKEHLSNLHDVPSGVENKSVGEAFTDAEGKYKQYQNDFLENPEQYKVNSQGKEYGNSSSAFGDYDYRLQKGTAGTLAEEGKKLLSVENPDALGAQLKNLRNAPDSAGLVKSNLLAVAKEKGFDKAYTPEVKAQLEANGFSDVSKDIEGIGNRLKAQNYTISEQNKLLESARQDEQDKLEKSFANKVVKNGDVAKLLQDKDMQQQALDLAAKQNDGGATTRGLGKTILDHIKEQSITTTPNKLGEGEVSTTNYEKFYDNFTANKDLLAKTLPKDQMDALTTLNKELAQSSFMARTNASADNTLKEGSGTAEKLNEIALKGTISKLAGVPIGAASSFAGLINKVRQNKIDAVIKDALSNPARALELINAAKAAPKDTTIFKQFIDTAFDRLPAIAGQHTVPNDVRSNKNDTLPNINVNTTGGTGGGGSTGQFPDNYKEPSKKNSIQVADATQVTGMPKEYFKALEKAETQGTKNPNTARPLDENGIPKSSAYGSSQFTRSTYNEQAVKHGLPLVTDKNELTANDPRSNPKYSRLAAGYYGADNANKLRPWLKDNLNREPTIGDVYGAHLMGLNGVKQFLSADPDSSADKVVPMAAKNNKSLFYDKDGKSLSVREVYHNIEDRLLP